MKRTVKERKKGKEKGKIDFKVLGYNNEGEQNHFGMGEGMDG